MLAAHGETSGEVNNLGLLQIASTLSARGVAAEIGTGFLKGSPSIAEAIGTFAMNDIVAYPFFFSNGYFSRIRLPQLLKKGRRNGQTIEILPPLGLDPALAGIVGRKAAAVAAARGFDVNQTTLILLGHGSRKDAAPRWAAERLAKFVGGQGRFQAVCVAFLEEPPGLEEAAAGVAGPLVVVGLFSGDGIHGGGDASRLFAELGRQNAVFAGNAGNDPEIADVIAAALNRWQSR